MVKRIAMRGAILTLASLFMGCTEDGDSLASVFAEAEWIDLTHTFDSSTVYWPTATAFQLDSVFVGAADGGYWYEANDFSAAEHGGTHLDAPAHFARGRDAADEIPLNRLIGPAVVVDVTAASAADPDYLLDVSDLEQFEATHGSIPDGSILLVRTGWSARWPDPARYLGTAMQGADAVAELHFPGVAPEAAEWLVQNRDIAAIGIDTPSIDFGQSAEYHTHRILYAENIPGFENVAYLDRLPAVGAFVVALPMKIGGGSGGPLRIVAVVPVDD